MAKKPSKKQALWNDVLAAMDASVKASKTPEQYAVYRAYQDKCRAADEKDDFESKRFTDGDHD